MPSRDIILDLCQMIESQGFNYFLVIIDDKKSAKEDMIECISSLNEKSLQNLLLFLREYKKEQKKIDNKKEKTDKKEKEDENGKDE